MRGGDLFGALKSLNERVPLTEKQILGLARQIIAAVAHLHKQCEEPTGPQPVLPRGVSTYTV